MHRQLLRIRRLHTTHPLKRPDSSSGKSPLPAFTPKPPTYTQTPNPAWKFGDGSSSPSSSSTSSSSSSSSASPGFKIIDPSTRPPSLNYKLLISAITPRPIALISTRSPSGHLNLAPFSFFNMIAHDPPLFIVSLQQDSLRKDTIPRDSSQNPDAGATPCKDTLRNLTSTRECVVSIISEPFIDAANAACIDAPHGSSEWPITGLTPIHDALTVGPPRVGEAVFSFEARVDSLREFESRAVPGSTSAVLVVLEATRFWVREDALNDDGTVDISILKPISRLGGITYGTSTNLFQIPRPRFERDLGGHEGFTQLEKSQSKSKS